MSCQPDMDTEIIGLSQAVPVVLGQGTEGGRYDQRKRSKLKVR